MKFFLIACSMFLIVGCSPKTASNTEEEKVVEILKRNPFWLDLVQLPFEGFSIDAADQRKLDMLASSYAAIANYDTDVIRKAAHAYIDGASGDQKVLMNSNLLVLNRYLFNIEWPGSYPVDSSEGKLKILPASPFGSDGTDALGEFDAFEKAYGRRPKKAGTP